jgi:hypothetical protein
VAARQRYNIHRDAQLDAMRYDQLFQCGAWPKFLADFLNTEGHPPQSLYFASELLNVALAKIVHDKGLSDTRGLWVLTESEVGPALADEMLLPSEQASLRTLERSPPDAALRVAWFIGSGTHFVSLCMLTRVSRLALA